jgi:aryl-alcohol dehydrogenase-like predicted oxidoreductase
MDFAKTHRIALVAYSVLLNGAYARPDRALPWQYRGPDSDARLQVLSDVADELGTTPNHVVIAWLAQCDPPVIPIIGGSTIDQVRANIAAVSVHLSEQQIVRLATAGEPTPDVDLAGR